MRHKRHGKKLNRNSSHRQAMLRNMAVSMILASRSGTDELNVMGGGRIVTTVQKAKYLRPFMDRLVTLSKRAALVIGGVPDIPPRKSSEWMEWRSSERWITWVNLVSPAVSLRRRAFSLLRNDVAVSVLFHSLADRFESRQGGYVRVIRMAARRIGDSGQLALIEFVGEHDRRRHGVLE